MRKKHYETVGELIRAYRLLRNLSQTKLGALTGLTQASISNIETGGPNRRQTEHPRKMELIFMKLRIPRREYQPFIVAGIRLPSIAEKAAPQDFVVYYSKALRGGLAINMELHEKHPRPSVLANVADSYGIIVSGTTMIPAYEPGHVIWVNPHLPASGGSDVLLRSAKDPNFALLRRLESETETEWHVLQYNPPLQSTLLKSDWPVCERIVGRYNP